MYICPCALGSNNHFNNFIMREIKFRGQKISGEWVYGDLINICGGYLIYHGEKQDAETIPQEDSLCAVGFYSTEISPIKTETIGQFTGLYDKNGREIWEGDIVCHYEHLTWEWRGVIKFSHGVFGSEFLSNIKNQSMVGSWGQKHNLRRLDDDILDRYIVIGNIHENPELL